MSSDQHVTDSVDRPSEPGVYWRRLAMCTEYHQLVAVTGSAPYLSMEIIWRRPGSIPCSGHDETPLYGPRITPPMVPPTT